MSEPESAAMGTSADPPSGQPSPPLPRSRLGAYAVALDRDGRILLCRLSADEVEAGAWTLPGGGVEFGEHPDDTVLRELEEESGLTGRIDDVLGIFSKIYTHSRAADGADLHFLGLLYRVAVTGGTIRDELDGSTDTCAWLRPDELRGRRIVAVARHAIELAMPDLGLVASERAGSFVDPSAEPSG